MRSNLRRGSRCPSHVATRCALPLVLFAWTIGPPAAVFARVAPALADIVNAGLGAAPPEVRRGDPREAMAGFLDACQRGRFDLAAFYLDLGGVPPQRQREEGGRLARRLMLTLQRTVWVDPEKLSNEPLGTPEPGVPEAEQRIATIEIRHHRTDLFLARRLDPALGQVWTISQTSVAQIDQLYGARGYGWLGDHAPAFLFAVALAGLQLWQWLALLLGLALGWIAARYLGRLALMLGRRLGAQVTQRWDEVAVQALQGPLGLFLWAGMLALVARWLGLAPEAWTIARAICRLLVLWGVGWFLLRLVDLAARRVRQTAGTADAVKLGFLPMAVRFAKGVAVVLVGLAALDVIGINVLAILAGLGLGGVALAFAAQKTLENVFGTISIAGDRPFEVGDYVTIGDETGTVEDVGFRSTRLRTLARTLVTIPNGVVASGRVENFSARDRILYRPTIGLAYGATTAQVAYVVDEVSRLLADHPKVFPGDRRVRFAGFGASALQIEVYCAITTRDWAEYTTIVEDLNFAIAGIVEFAGCQFALPGRAGYARQPRPSDPDRERAIEAALARRHQGKRP